VLREAVSLFEAGYSITVLAQLDDETPPFENQNRIIVRRISANRIHLEFVNLIRRFVTPKVFIN